MMFADRFGFTPDQTDALSAEDEALMIPVHDMLLEVRNGA